MAFNSTLQIKSELLINKISTNDDIPTGLNNHVISLVFLICAIFSMLFLLVVILIHSKYSKFRKGIYSIIFACIINEYLYSLIYFIHGLDFLTFKVLESNDTVCNVFSFVGIFLVSNLLAFNSMLIINLLLNRIPFIVKKKSKPYQMIIRDSFLNIREFSFLRLHLVCFLIGITSAVYTYLTDNLGRNKTGECLIKDNANNFTIFHIVLVTIYVILVIVYLFHNVILKKQFSQSFPMLKNYWIYLLSTSIGWGLNTINIEKNDDNVMNSISVIAGIMVFLIVAFFRFSCGYIKNILKQESSNRFIAMIMILFCVDNKADTESYETRSNMIMKTDFDYMKTEINDNNIN